jgi:hypothetical protein
MHLKVFLKLKKTIKIVSSGQIYIKKQKNQKTPKKTKKNKKPKRNPLGWFFLTLGFSNPA